MDNNLKNNTIKTLGGFLEKYITLINFILFLI